MVWVLCGDDDVVLLTPGIMNKTTKIAGSKRIYLGASLSGGQKNVSRLDTQLFRASLVNEDKAAQSQMILIVNLE